MPGVIRTSFNKVVLAARAELVAFTKIPKPRVLIIAPRRGPSSLLNVQGDRVIFLRPGAFKVVEAAQAGAGRAVLKIRRYLDVIPRVRRQVDTANAQALWLTTEGMGYIALEEKIIDCLELFWPEDADGNALLFEPMRLVDGTEPSRDLEPREGWGDASLRFEVSYLLNVDLTRAQ